MAETNDLTPQQKAIVEKAKRKKSIRLPAKPDEEEGKRVFYSKTLDLDSKKDLTPLDINTNLEADSATLIRARNYIDLITEGETRIEELTKVQKYEVLWFLYTFVSYVESGVDLKTHFMSTSISFNLPDNLRLDNFQKDTILGLYRDMVKSSESFLYSLFAYHNLFGCAYLKSSDNWEENTLALLSKGTLEPSAKKIKETLENNPGVGLSELFQWISKSPVNAEKYFKTEIDILETDETYKEHSQNYDVDPKSLTPEELNYMREKAFPLLKGFKPLIDPEVLDPVQVEDTLEENPLTNSFTIVEDKEPLLLTEPEYVAAVAVIDAFYTKYPADSELEPQEKGTHLEDMKASTDKINQSIVKLSYKGYNPSVVSSYLYSDDEKQITIGNNPFRPLHLYKIEGNTSITSSSSEKLIENGIDLLNAELRQRSHINDTREKLVTLNISDTAYNKIPANVIEDIIDEIATSIMEGESQIIQLPDGVSLEDKTDIIRASNDTEPLSEQSKANIARIFSMSQSMLEDSDVQFSNTYLKIDTAQNSFSKDRSAIISMMADKIFKPAGVKVGFYARNNHGEVVLVEPEISFSRISIGRQSEDYDAIVRMVEDKVLPKSELYKYHNSTEAENSPQLLKEALTISNPDILEAVTLKLQTLIQDDLSGEALTTILKGDTLSILSLMKKDQEVKSGDFYEGDDEND